MLVNEAFLFHVKGFQMKLFFAIVFAVLTPAASMADIGVSFREGAPKDRFEIANVSKCALVDAEIVIDLNGSAGGLIFDVTATGAGVEVFQPFEIVAGGQYLVGLPQVKDGDRGVLLKVAQLPAGEKISFTIDVDDTVNAREITVADSELSGAKVLVKTSDASNEQVFASQPRLNVTTPGCS